MSSLFSGYRLRLGMVIAVMVVLSLAETSISTAISSSTLRRMSMVDIPLVATGLRLGRLAGLVAMLVLWIAGRSRALVVLIIVANGLFTIGLLAHTMALLAVLFWSAALPDIRLLLRDVVLLLVSNMLIFSVWYWMIDPPRFEEVTRDDEPWDFLFPQRASPLPHYEAWVPQYLDYLFIAFTTSFSFGPSDVLPLTRRAKMLMLLQASISIVILTVIAASAVNILVEGK